MTARHAIGPAYLAACLLLGGASAAGLVANLVLQLAALPLIGWALWTLLFDPPPAQIRPLLLLCAALLLFLCLQLIPLPPSVWSLLPGRGAVVDGYRLLGLPLPWLPISLAPDKSVASMLWLLPALTMLLTVAVLRAFRASWLAWTIAVVTGLSVVLGALQIVGGESPVYLYSITNYGVAVGFFANANHEATLLLVAIPFVVALQRTASRRTRSYRSDSAIRVMVGAALAVIAVGLLTNLSLAGLGLSIPVFAVTWLSLGDRKRAVSRWIVAGAGLLCVVTIGLVIFGPFGNNLVGSQSHMETSRQLSFALTLRAAATYFPFGSGVGTFQDVYHTQEPLQLVTRVFMNHAHSDWIEMLLETGLVGILLAAAFLFWWVVRVRAIWGADERDHFGRAAAIASGTIMLHSLVDYPLRTAAIGAVFAACVGLMAGARPYMRRVQRLPSARHLTI